MTRVYENKRLYLSDLAPLGRDHVNRKKFVNCEIIGPGNIVVCLRAPGDQHFPQFTKNLYHDVDFIQIDMEKKLEMQYIFMVVISMDANFTG